MLYAVDLETTDLSPDHGDIRLVAVTNALGSWVTTEIEKIAPMLADPSALKIVHNALFDVYWLRRRGFQVVNFTDTLILAQILRGDVKQGNSLADLARGFLGIELDKELQSAENWQGEIAERHARYAMADSDATYRLYPVLMERIRERGLDDAAGREVRALSAAIRMQCDGILFNYEGWSAELAEYQAEMRELEIKIRLDLNRPDLNLRSAPQLLQALLRAGLDVRSTAAEELAKNRHASPVVGHILHYKGVQKLLSTYADKLLDKIGTDGRLRGDWRLLGTVTGRMTCSRPNLQGLPKSAKRYCVAEPGWRVVTADFSQIELRVLAQLSGEPVMVDSFRSGDDLHRRTAAKVFGKPEADVTDRERKAGKIINFGLIYGMTAMGLRNKLSAEGGLPVTLAQAARFRNAYFDLYPAVLRFQNAMLLATTVRSLGGRRWDTKLLEENRRLNYPVQATAAEGLKEALCLLNDRMPGHWKLIAAIHDELVIEVPEGEAEAASKLLQDSMIEGMQRIVTEVPIQVDVSVGDYWIK
ncbi:MAG: DNA polymerase [Bacilli bacterium]